jgi:hypothetical protein
VSGIHCSQLYGSQLYERRKTIAKNKEFNIVLTLASSTFLDLNAAGEHSPEKKIQRARLCVIIKKWVSCLEFCKAFQQALAL